MSERVVVAYARLALGLTFLAQIAARAGVWGAHRGADGWRHFVAYTAEVNAFMPARAIPLLAIAATVAELTLGIALVIGVWPRATALASAGLLALFALAMTISLGVKEPIDYSVFSAIGAALLVATRSRTSPHAASWPSYPRTSQGKR